MSAKVLGNLIITGSVLNPNISGNLNISDLSYPDFDFAATSELPNVIYYSFITDSGATIATTGTVDISGNIYANNLKFTGPTSTGAKTTVTTSGNSVMTVKYNVDLKNTNMTTESGTVVWAKNLILDSSEADPESDLLGSVPLKI